MEQVIDQTNHDDHGHEPTDDVDSLPQVGDYLIRMNCSSSFSSSSSWSSSSLSSEEGFDVGFTCNICLEEPQAGDYLIRINCSHMYHQSCLLLWLQNKHNTCPYCRCKLDQQ
ncbi:hypothetical protein ACB092_06G062200 [Castanea dentata]